jgi:hypothetical protein
MPRWLTRDLSARLKVQKLPYYSIVDGPQALDQRPGAEPHIVLQRDQGTGDTTGPPRGRGLAEARNLMLLSIGMELLIFARSTARTNQTVDHEDQSDDIRKQVLVALYHVFQGYDGVRWRVGPGRFLTKQEIDERHLQSWPGRIYRLPFSFDDTVKDENYKGSGLDTIDGGAIDYETETETLGQGGTELPSASTELP